MRTSTIAYRIRVGALLVLALGLAWAAWLFFSPDKGQPAGLGYEIIGGQSFAVNPADSKRYLYEVERMGGKFGVLQEEISLWFQAQWQGSHKARTIALLTLALTALGFWVAHEVELVHDAESGSA